ncbi:trichocyst matrix protein T4-B, putative (macronuclear) [Tetrahymena thermophila SB210]|uniref:Trichocyst matrix protein T4-B, putative n=1 Tax=Tetrahymena thermophila (strain SB210) TaxID=312017 RepID=I7MCH6_TETTS|nr:trichocyst matrix protein T4-B, putative [Tetrahymena thermophila SB210]EAR83961.3 trichocyst matrix protein T4-B, putative [Tetrahymena thermophila SB210]|eukprot:XP_001031624.3 trichocyst matrix protein T4-B, putative [Tetrahymena thermophila SB210]
MNKKLFVVLITLAVVFATRRETNVALAEMRRSAFGATILSTIQLNLAAMYDVSPITTLVDQILQSLQESQAAADYRNSTNQVRCDQNIEQFSRQIKDTQNTISSLQSQINSNQDSLQRDNYALQQASEDYDNTDISIDKGTVDREDAHERWEQSDKEITEALNALDEATKLIQHMVHGVSFAQIKSRYDKVLEKLTTNKSKHSTLFKPLIIALSQLSSQLNNDSIQKILNLLQNLRQALTDAQDEGRVAEETAQNLWQKLLEQLQINKQKYDDEKQRLTDQIISISALLNQQKNSLENNNNSLENFIIQLQDEQTLCQKQSLDYEDETKENQKESAILMELKEHLNEKFSQVVEFIQ